MNIAWWHRFSAPTTRSMASIRWPIPEEVTGSDPPGPGPEPQVELGLAAASGSRAAALSASNSCSSYAEQECSILREDHTICTAVAP